MQGDSVGKLDQENSDQHILSSATPKFTNAKMSDLLAIQRKKTSVPREDIDSEASQIHSIMMTMAKDRRDVAVNTDTWRKLVGDSNALKNSYV